MKLMFREYLPISRELPSRQVVKQQTALLLTPTGQLL
jgi:hypothetical protein